MGTATAPPASRILPAGRETHARNRRVPRAGLGSGVRHLFLADAALNLVAVLGANGKMKTLGGFEEPQGLTSDGSGNLYVANTIAQNVEVFAPPYRSTPASVLSVSGQWPVDVAVAPDGMVAAINVCQASGTQCGASGSVYFYANASASSPCATVSGGSRIDRLLWGGFDAQDTLYVAGVQDYTTARIGRITGGCGATTLSTLDPNVKIDFPSGVVVDPHGRVAVIDSHGFSGPAQIDLFTAPKPGSRRLRLLQQGTLEDSGVVVSFALNRSGTRLFTAEPHYSMEYVYPQGGSAIAEFAPPSGGDLIEGVAITPAEVP